jgi:hypothetical protein
MEEGHAKQREREQDEIDGGAPDARNTAAARVSTRALANGADELKRRLRAVDADEANVASMAETACSRAPDSGRMRSADD